MSMINPAKIVKVVSAQANSTNFDAINKTANKAFAAIEFPNKKVTNNMLDTLIEATGIKVDGYNPKAIVDYMA